VEIFINGLGDEEEWSRLQSISFPDLEVAKELVISHNPNLVSASFPSLTKTTTSSIHLISNGGEGDEFSVNFPLLESVGTNLELQGGYWECCIVTFPSLVRVPETLSVTNIYPIEEITFPNLLEADDLVVVGNLYVESINVPNLTTVTDSLLVRDNEFLLGLLAGSLVQAGELVIDLNPDLNNLDLSSLTTITGDLEITDNSSLSNLDAFSSLTSVVRNVKVRSNTGLSNVAGLGGIGDAPGSTPPLITDSLVVSNNLSLCNTDAGALIDAIDAKAPGEAIGVGWENEGNYPCGAWPSPSPGSGQDVSRDPDSGRLDSRQLEFPLLGVRPDGPLPERGPVKDPDLAQQEFPRPIGRPTGSARRDPPP
jgi:hypothetical protein